MDKPKKPKTATTPAKKAENNAKKDRLESSLRANLLRRKQQPKGKK